MRGLTPGAKAAAPGSREPAKQLFEHEFAWDKLGRKGQRCQLLYDIGLMAHVRFEDGFELVVSRRAIRRAKGAAETSLKGTTPPHA